MFGTVWFSVSARSVENTIDSFTQIQAAVALVLRIWYAVRSSEAECGLCAWNRVTFTCKYCFNGKLSFWLHAWDKLCSIFEMY